VAGEVDLSPTGSAVRTLAEATLALVLFSDASRIKLSVLRRDYEMPLRLLGVGLPLTIALGAALAAVIFGQLTLAETLVLAVLLAPTDAALGQAVVTEPRLPSRIRQGLNVESGLNDGICVPLLFIALAAADVNSNITSGNHAVTIVVEELGYGVLAGVASGLLVTFVVRFAGGRHLIARSWMQVVPVAGAALAYGLAAALGGSGFIAAFVAGALFGMLVEQESEAATRLTEEIGQLLNGVTFVVFGAVLLGPALQHVSWQILVYGLLSLTLVRMLPVAIAMLRSGARLPTVGFVGWFGPRGLASIVFAVIVVERADLPHADTILMATYITVGLSVFAHGVSAAPLAERYARWYESHPRNRRPAMESVPAAAHRPRGPSARSA
jgi:sodium/hydrogen antiporter